MSFNSIRLVGAPGIATETKPGMMPASERAERSLLASDYPDASDLIEAAAARAVGELALRRRFLGPDGTTQFEVEWTPYAAEYWRCVGAIAGNGAALVAWSDSGANVDGNFAAKGAGGFHFGNGAGELFSIEDNGSGNVAVNKLKVKAGDTNNNPQLTSTIGIDYSVVSGGFYHNFCVGGNIHARIGKDVGSTDRWAWIYSNGTSSYVYVTADGTAADVGLFLGAKGTSNVVVWNSKGALASFTPIDSNTITSNLLFRSASTTQSVVIDITSSNTDCGMRLKAKGVGVLSLEAAKTTASGEFVSIPKTTASTLTVNGQFVVERTSDTSITLKLRGSDGVTRSSSPITLA